MKRIFDFIFSLISLVILLPLFLAVTLMIILSSPGGVFFRGIRIGLHGRPFRIFKFRSMVQNAEGKGKWNIGSQDKRITPIGKLLRNTKIDEFPQLINIIFGEMSFVGPRPELPVYIAMYSNKEKPILDSKPGITDWASITHFDQYEIFTKSKDPDSAYLKFIRPLKLELQLYYRYHNSFSNDIKILFWTFFKTITRSQRLPLEIKPIISEYKSTLISYDEQ